MTGYFIGSDKQVRDCKTGKLCAERAAEVMREALEWYANADYESETFEEGDRIYESGSEAASDGGERARNALALIDSVEVNTA